MSQERRYSVPVRWSFGREIRVEEKSVFLKSVRDALLNPGRYSIKRSGHREVLFIPETKLYVKVYVPTKVQHLARAVFLKSPGQHEFEVSERLCGRDFPCVKAVMWGSAAGHISIFVSRAVERSISFVDALNQPELDRLTVIREAANLLARLHRLGYRMGDLPPQNILVQLHPESTASGVSLGAESRIEGAVLIDHETTRFFLGFLQRGRAQNLLGVLFLHPEIVLDQDEKEFFLTEYLITLAGVSPKEETVRGMLRHLAHLGDRHAGRRRRVRSRSPIPPREKIGKYLVFRRRGIQSLMIIESLEASCSASYPLSNSSARMGAEVEPVSVSWFGRLFLRTSLTRKARVADYDRLLGFVKDRSSGEVWMVSKADVSAKTKRCPDADLETGADLEISGAVSHGG